MSNTWVQNKKTGKFESKPDSYRPPAPKKPKPFNSAKRKNKYKKPDKKEASAYYGNKNLDLQALKRAKREV